MSRLLVALFVLVNVAAADTLVRARIEPDKGARVGEPVTLSVEFLTTKWFASGPRLPELDLSGTIVRRLSSFGINGTAEVDGTRYTTQTWEYTIYPQHAGRFTVPALNVRIFPAGEGGAAEPVDATTSVLSFEVDPLPGGAALSAAAFSATQVYAPTDRKSLMVGGSLTRTITLKTDGAPAMLIPPLGASEADGMTAYPNSPMVDDSINRGEISGTRVESVTYVFERPGTYRFPEIRIPWWNIARKSIETVTLTGLDVEVAPNPELASAEAGAPPGDVEETGGFPWWFIATPALLFALFLALRRPVLRVRERRAASEPAAFAALKRARGARATYLALGAWFACAGLEPDPELRRLTDALGDHLYGNGGGWDRAALLAAAKAQRDKARRATRAGCAALPPLNPTLVPGLFFQPQPRSVGTPKK